MRKKTVAFLSFSLIFFASFAFANNNVTKVEVFPGNVTMEPGTELRFTVVAFTSSGMAFTPKNIAWYTTGGRIDRSGHFYAGQREGYYDITVNYGRYRAKAKVYINRPAPTISRIIITPSHEKVYVGEKLRLQAQAYDNYNRPVSFRPQWSSHERGASVNPKGIFYADYPGSYTVIATAKNSGIKGVARIQVVKKNYYPPQPPPSSEAKIVVGRWDVGGGNFFRPKAKISCQVFGSYAQVVRLFLVSDNGHLQELQAFSCSSGSNIKFDTKYNAIGAKSIQIRLYNNQERVIAKYERRLY